MEQLFGADLFDQWGGWIGQVFVVVFVTLTLDLFLKLFMRRLRRRVERTHNVWDDAFVDSISRPLSALVWILGLSFALMIVEHVADATIFEIVGPLRDLGVIIVITWFLLDFIRHARVNVLDHRQSNELEVDQTTVDAVTKLLRLSILITAALVALQTLGFSISGVLAFGGIGGIAVGFAAKDLLANFFGGLMIYLDRPFAVGDWIKSPDREIEGVVEHIGWRLTRIRTFDKRPLYVPNSVFANITVENPQRMTHRRIYETIGVRYEDADKLDAIARDVRQMLIAHPEINHEQILMVNFNQFAASSLDFFVYTFTHTTDWARFHEIKHDVLLKIYRIIADHGADIAFPTSTLHVPEPVVLSGSGDVGSGEQR